jgi:hypothetical protein
MYEHKVNIMFQYEPVLQPGNKHYVHHMLLYECVAPHQFASTDSIFQKFVEHSGESCYSPAMPPEWDQCMSPIVAWAVGSEGMALEFWFKDGFHILHVFRSCVHCIKYYNIVTTTKSCIFAGLSCLVQNSKYSCNREFPEISLVEL